MENAHIMDVNAAKSNIVHFRPKSVVCTQLKFMCGNNQINSVDRYTYLGVALHENLDYNITVKYVAQSASRALTHCQVQNHWRGAI